MNKHLLLTSFLASFLVPLLSFSVFGQDVTGYTMTPSVGAFTPLTGGTPSSLTTTADDEVSAAIPIGFTFNYGGSDFTSVRINSNGLLCFDAAGSSSLSNSFTSTATGARPSIAPLWDDLQCTEGASYKLSGTSPNQILTVEWLNMEWNFSSGTAVISFQVNLFETSNEIEFVYRQEGTAVNSGSASIGLLGLASGNYASLSDASGAPVVSSSTANNSIATKPATGQSYLWVPSSCFAPDGFTASNSTTTSVDLTWNPGVGASGYTIEWGPVGFTPGTGSETGSVSEPTTSTTVTGLTPDTYYQFYIQSDCGSNWTGPISVNTFDLAAFMTWDATCPTGGFTDISATGTPTALSDDGNIGVTMPFPISFQGIMVTDLTIGNNGGVILGTTGGSVGTSGSVTTATNGLYPFWDDLDTEEGDVYYETVGTAPNRIFIIQYEARPHYSGVVGQSITFQIQIEEATHEIYYVYEDVVFGGTQASYDYGLDAEIGLAGPTQDLSVSSFDDAFLMSNSCVHFFYTDCPAPTSFMTTAVAADNADISWTAGLAGEMNWTIIYGESGFDPLTEGTTITSTTTSTNLPGLLSLTSYDVYIYADCDVATQSNPLVGNFTTEPNCSDVTGMLNSAEIDSIFLSWTWTESSPSVPATGFNVQYGVSGFTLYSEGDLITFDSNLTDSIIDPSLISSATYDIYIQAVCGADTSNYVGPFTVTIPIENDNVCSATDLPVDGTAYSFNCSAATVEVGETAIAPPATGCSTDDGWCNSDLTFTTWFTFVAPGSGGVGITGEEGGFDGQVAIYKVDDCSDWGSFTLIAANDDDFVGGTGFYPSLNVCGLIPGDTYYILHDAYSTFSGGNYTLKLTELSGGSAGEPSMVALCKNEPFDLFDALVGTYATSGTWYDIVDAPLPGSGIFAEDLTGLYNYDYIVPDGTCPGDTTTIIINVLECDYLGLNTTSLDEVVIYPNPSTGKFVISNIISNTDVMIYDLNGRTIFTADYVSKSFEIDLSNEEKGVYIIQMKNGQSIKTERIIIQ